MSDNRFKFQARTCSEIGVKRPGQAPRKTCCLCGFPIRSTTRVPIRCREKRVSISSHCTTRLARARSCMFSVLVNQLTREAHPRRYGETRCPKIHPGTLATGLGDEGIGEEANRRDHREWVPSSMGRRRVSNGDQVACPAQFVLRRGVPSPEVNRPGKL